ncbi:MAG TPA: DUF4105 domain-containing protein [Myxococcota bacterium]|nr:DUF4105 domain-containing protein [Myxococcota bacterium]
MTIGILLGSAWACMALWLDTPGPPEVGRALSLAFAVASLAAVLARRSAVRLAWFAAFGALVAGWLALPARQDRDWLLDVARLPRAEISGDRVVLHDVRSFTYRSETDFDPRWETRSYDLAQITGMDLFMSYWGSPWIAHTILSFDFADGRHLAVSIETRKERGESYSALRGFFRQFELYYVAADERDVVALRTNQRDERVLLYRLAAPPARARAVLLAYLDEMNQLAAKPRWYNALTHNCTTSIRLNALAAGVAFPRDWRVVANGRLDELLYEQGALNRDLPLAELRARSDIGDRARDAGNAADFSERIRAGLPERPAREETD